MGNIKCRECKHHRDILGDCHISCLHPDSGIGNHPLSSMIIMLGKQMGSYYKPSDKMNITANEHGIKHCWCNWPFNYHEIWLETCDCFEEIGS
jgi:hypothetical protein